VCAKRNCACDLIFTYQLLRHNHICVSSVKCGNYSVPHPHWIPLKKPNTDKELSARVDRFELFNLFKTVIVPISMSNPVLVALIESGLSDAAAADSEANFSASDGGFNNSSDGYTSGDWSSLNSDGDEEEL